MGRRSGGDASSEITSHGAFVLPSEVRHAYPLLGRNRLSLGSRKSRGKCTVSSSDALENRRLGPKEGDGGERHIHMGHAQPEEWRDGIGEEMARLR